MLALWLAAGVLGAGEAFTFARGDDGGVRPSRGERESFWRRKAEDWIAEQLTAIEGAVERPHRIRRRLALRVSARVPEFVSSIPEFAPRVSALSALADRVALPVVDYSALASAIAREMEIIAEWRVRKRRRRDVEALLILS